MSRTSLHTLAVVTTLVMLAACQQPSGTTGPGYGEAQTAATDDPRFTVVDDDLRQTLGFLEPLVIDDQGPMQVEVPVRNLSDGLCLVDYRIVFFDDAGAEVDPTMGWRLSPLEPKQTARLEGVASGEAAAWRLEVRWAR